MGIFLDKNKVLSLKEAAALVKDGDSIAIGGGGCLREPIAFIEEMIRQDRKGLRALGTAHGFDIDLMCGAGMVSEVQYTHVSYESDFGLALNYRKACESGKVKIREDG